MSRSVLLRFFRGAVLRVMENIVLVALAAAVLFAEPAHSETWVPTGGRLPYIENLALDPSNSAVLYAATENGVFKSTDAGASWQRIGLWGSFVYSLAIDPSNPAVLYAVGADGPSIVWKSTDRGDSWQAISSELPNYPGPVSIDGSNPAVLYVLTDGGVFKSTDSGANWQVMSTGLPSAESSSLSLDPSNPAVFYAYAPGVFKSTDSGASWQAIRTGLPNESRVLSLVVDPSNSTVLYAATTTGIFKSIDGGGSWQASSTGLPNQSSVYSLAFDPSNSAVLFAGADRGIFKSSDGGASWQSSSAELSVRSLVFDPSNPAVLYAGTANGLVFKYVTDSLPSVASTILFLHGIAGSEIRTCVVLPTDPESGQEPLSLALYYWPSFDYTIINGLGMNTDGTSASKLAVGELISSVGLVRGLKLFSKEVYGKFEQFMNDRFGKDGWEPFTYDWRLSAERIVNEPGLRMTWRECSERKSVHDLQPSPSLRQRVLELASSSPTGKVTIIAHSNGGLIAKLLVQKLEGDASKIDNLILVAVPQMGTPTAVETTLHGEEFPLPSVVFRRSMARELVSNMPGIYQLLPSRQFFSPSYDLIGFRSDLRSDLFVAERDLYGEAINDGDEFRRFLLALPPDPRYELPEGKNLDIPAKLSTPRLAEAENLHNQIDSFVAPSGMRVVQIAGTELSTPRAILYEPKQLGFFRIEKPTYLQSHHGDGTVLVHSATAMTNAESYYVLLEGCTKPENGENDPRQHRDILALSPVQDLIWRIVSNMDVAGSLSGCIKKQSDELPSVERTIFYHASPATLGATDSRGRYTGPGEIPIPSDFEIAEENIPGSIFRFPHYMSLPTNGAPYNIEIHGAGTGTFSFYIERLVDDVTVEKVVYPDVPVTPATFAGLTYLGRMTQPTLQVDVDGDGQVDLDVAPLPSAPPYARIEAPQVVRPESSAQFDGRSSFDPDNGPAPLAFSWTQTSGPTASLVGSGTSTPIFRPMWPGLYEYRLVVNDGQSDSSPASARIAVPLLGDANTDGILNVADLSLLQAARGKPASSANDLRDLNGDGTIDDADVAKLLSLCGLACNQPPTAYAGVDRTIEASLLGGASITLNGTASRDPDGDSLTFNWAGPFGMATGPTPSVMIPLGINVVTLTVADGKGGTATATVTITVVDTIAPAISIASPTATAYRLRQAVASSYNCQDSGSGVASCAGPAPSGSSIDTASVGAKTFTVNASDKAGNAASRSVTYTVGYGICPLYDQTKAHKSGSTVPIKLQLCDANSGNVSSPGTVVHAIGLAQRDTSATSVVEDSGNANPDDNFRFDASLGGTGGYIFNLSTKGMSAGTWVLNFTAGGDPTPHAVQFDVK